MACQPDTPDRKRKRQCPRLPTVLFVGAFRGTDNADSERFANSAFTRIWKEGFLGSIRELLPELNGRVLQDEPWTSPSTESVLPDSYVCKALAIRRELLQHEHIPAIPMPFNMILFGRTTDSLEEKHARRLRKQALYNFMRGTTPIACICALPAGDAFEFLETLDPLPFPTFLTVATNRDVTKPEEVNGRCPDRTHVVRLPPSNKLQAQTICERLRALSAHKDGACIFRSDIGDSYSLDLLREIEDGLKGPNGLRYRIALSKCDVGNDAGVYAALGYRENLELLLSEVNQDSVVIQSDGCGKESARRLEPKVRALYCVRPTREPDELAHLAYVAINNVHQKVRLDPPAGLADRLSGFRQKVVRELERLDGSFRFSDGENVGAWYFMENARE